jgi:hypothetical protein
MKNRNFEARKQISGALIRDYLGVLGVILSRRSVRRRMAVQILLFRFSPSGGKWADCGEIGPTGFPAAAAAWLFIRKSSILNRHSEIQRGALSF